MDPVTIWISNIRKFAFNTSLQARLIAILSDNSLHLWEVNFYENGTRL